VFLTKQSKGGSQIGWKEGREGEKAAHDEEEEHANLLKPKKQGRKEGEDEVSFDSFQHPALSSSRPSFVSSLDSTGCQT